ncbi:TPA: hypothetical protein LVL09_004860 [Klebsiella oxytoca]|nr:hypothetical protein [Klebsiella oxytoca]
MTVNKLVAAGLALFSSYAFSSEEAVMKCQMSILKFKDGQMIGEPRQMAEAILTADSQQFYVVIGERVISSPVLFEHKGDMAGYHAGAAYFIRKTSYGVMYDDFGYVFDECVKVTA